MTLPETAAPLVTALGEAGYAFVPAAAMRALLEASAPLADWASFRASWDRLEPDRYMADGGRYRRRRHAVFTVGPAPGAYTRLAHRAHFQSLDYNALNGGIERWFAAIEPAIGAGACMGTILRCCQTLFGALEPDLAWFVEAHQFRIEARASEPGQPTPEGLHRDGVDYVLVLMVERQNIASGETSIHDDAGRRLGSFTLAAPLDAALVHDRRVFHGVTAVEAVDPLRPAYRDVLVVTFRRAAASD